MSKISVDEITDEAGTGAPDFPQGMTGSGASLTALPAAQLTGTLPAINGASLTGLPVGNRNLIINGDMKVAQRGVSVTGVSSSGYHGPDRFQFNKSGSQFVASISQASDGPDGYSNSWKLQTTTAETAVDSSEYVLIIHRMEGQNLQHLKYGTSDARQLTVSFWVKSSVAATFGVYLYSTDGVRIIGSTYTINSASTWEYKTVTFAGDTSGTINDDNGDSLYLGFVVAAGSGWATTDNTSWSGFGSSKLAYGHSTAANAVMTTLNATWQITGVQLEVGSQSTDFEHRSYGDELARCQRYYHKYGSTSDGSAYQMLADGFLPTTSRIFSTFAFSPQMRAQPTMSTTGTPANYAIMNENANTAVTGGPAIDGQTSEQTVFLYADTGATMTAGQGAILRGNGTSAAFLGFDAEL